MERAEISFGLKEKLGRNRAAILEGIVAATDRCAVKLIPRMELALIDRTDVAGTLIGRNIC